MTVPLNMFGPTAARDHLDSKPPRPETITVDLHSHQRVLETEEFIKPHLPPEGANTAFQMANTRSREIYHEIHSCRVPEWTDPVVRIQAMDEMDIDLAALSVMPTQFYFMVDPQAGMEACQMNNAALAESVRKHPNRLVGLGTLPMQDTDLAIQELDRCINELGFKGIQIGARVVDEELSAPRFEPLWSRCEELDVPIFIHPSSFQSPRFARHHLANVIGNPLDTTVAVHYLIFDGVMARHPKIKFYLAHGGAFAAAYSARMDHAFGARPDCRDHIDELPSTYLKQFYVDGLVFAPDQLAYLVKKFGSDHVVIGTDYPADMGDFQPVELVYQTEGLSEAERQNICGLNAMKLMNLDPADFEQVAG